MGDTTIARIALLAVTAFALALAACNDEGDERPGLAEIRARGLVCNVSSNGLQPGGQMIFPAGQTGPLLESRYRTTNDLVGEVQWRPVGTRYRRDDDVLLAAEPVRMRPLTTVRQTGDGIVVTFFPTPNTPLNASCVVPEPELSVPDGVGDRTTKKKP